MRYPPIIQNQNNTHNNQRMSGFHPWHKIRNNAHQKQRICKRYLSLHQNQNNTHKKAKDIRYPPMIQTQNNTYNRQWIKGIHPWHNSNTIHTRSKEYDPSMIQNQNHTHIKQRIWGFNQWNKSNAIAQKAKDMRPLIQNHIHSISKGYRVSIQNTKTIQYTQKKEKDMKYPPMIQNQNYTHNKHRIWGIHPWFIIRTWHKKAKNMRYLIFDKKPETIHTKLKGKGYYEVSTLFAPAADFKANGATAHIPEAPTELTLVKPLWQIKYYQPVTT